MAMRQGQESVYCKLFLISNFFELRTLLARSALLNSIYPPASNSGRVQAAGGPGPMGHESLWK